MANLSKTTFGKRTKTPLPPMVADALKNSAPIKKTLLFRQKALAIVAATAIFGSFGALVVKAGDDSGVYDFIRSQSGSRGSAQKTGRLPPIFVPDAVYSRRALGYAPSYDYSYTPRKSDYTYPRSNLLERRKNKSVDKNDYFSDYRRSASKNTREPSTEQTSIARVSQPTAYCVRMCDGYYFPVGTGYDNFDKHEAACNSVCPSAQTRVYVAPSGSDDIGKASHRGQAYAKLGTAFSYRQQRSKTCSCNAASPAGGLGMFSPTYENDTTLTRGDVVVTNIGLKAFTGGGHFPHRTNEFIAASSAKSLTSKERATLSNLTDGGRRMSASERREDSRARRLARKLERRQKALALKTANASQMEIPKAVQTPAILMASGSIRNVAPNVSGTVIAR